VQFAKEQTMVQIIENWADILGVVQVVETFSELDGFDKVIMLVERVDAVEGYPNLLATYLEEVGEPRLFVLMPVDVVVEYAIDAGALLECRVRRAGPDRVFVNREYVKVIDPGVL
jgi:hypothetical protein